MFFSLSLKNILLNTSVVRQTYLIEFGKSYSHVASLDTNQSLCSLNCMLEILTRSVLEEIIVQTKDRWFYILRKELFNDVYAPMVVSKANRATVSLGSNKHDAAPIAAPYSVCLT